MKHKNKKGNGNGNSRDGANKWGSGSQTTDKNNNNKFSIAALKTDMISIKELLADQSKTMAALKTRSGSLNGKGKGGDKTAHITNFTNSALQRPAQHQK